jgi:hypothetical protein
MTLLTELARYIVFFVILIVGVVVSFDGGHAGGFLVGVAIAALLTSAAERREDAEELQPSSAVVKMRPDVERIRFFDMAGNMVGETRRKGNDQPIQIGIARNKGPRIVEITYRKTPANEAEEDGYDAASGSEGGQRA